MANQQLNVSLRFNADTSQAKKELRSLISEVEKISISANQIANNNGGDLSESYKKAANEATKFVGVLKSATDLNTGKLDLSKLNLGLKESGQTLDGVAKSFNSLGTNGIKAFANITQQINAAEIPLKKTNTLIDKMWTTLKNTAKWELSSSIVHGLESALSSAYGYAQDLNKSLNNIRIVSGQNIEQMAKFAEQANKAAKSLSTTTLDYTDASLIFYQQGLTDKEVQERTEVTIKMANAAGESASKISDQLTAVWNNFYDGSKSLEYYADVMTKLGAATASSTDEIAQGLEKFAAVSDTIGLSYEYATAALATVTSNTRESADVVGTAFKTIFSRMQDLDLGETLDDGTTLGSYARAMSKVGIEVLDTNGNLIEMDNILDQMASKWQVLSKSQQVALAQSVAGVRQYNQLVALMDNWNINDSDSMVANLEYVSNAEGSLQEQADIYAESWEAAQKRVQSSAEAIYSALINDDFFIDTTNVFADFLDIVKNLITSLGGIKGVLATITSYVLTIARSKMSNELKSISNTFSSSGIFGKKSKEQTANNALSMKSESNKALSEMAAQSRLQEDKAIAKTYSDIGEIQSKMVDKANLLTDVNKTTLELYIKQREAMGDILTQQGQQIDNDTKEYNKEKEKFLNNNNITAKDEVLEEWKYINGAIQDLGGRNLIKGDARRIGQNDIDRIKSLAKAYKVKLDFELAPDSSDNIEKALLLIQNKAKISLGINKEDSLKNLETTLNDIYDAENQALKNNFNFKDSLFTEEELQKIKDAKENSYDLIEVFEDIAESRARAFDQNFGEGVSLGISLQELTRLQHEYENLGFSAEEAKKKAIDYLDAIQQKSPSAAESLTTVADAAMSIVSVVSSWKGMADVFNSEDSDGLDKMTSMLTTFFLTFNQTKKFINKETLVNLSGLSSALGGVGLKAGEAGTLLNAATSAEIGLGEAAAGVILPILGYAAAIGAITAAIYLLYKEFYNASAQGQLEQTQEAIESLEKEIEETKIEAENLKTVLGNYDTAVEALNSCTYGTQEWKNALKETNAAALELINSMHGLSPEEIKNLYFRNDSGMIEFDREVISNYQDQLDFRIESGEYANALLKYQESMGKNASTIDDIVAELSSNNGLIKIKKDETGNYVDVLNEQDQTQYWSQDEVANLIKNNLSSLANALNGDELKNRLQELGVRVSADNEALENWLTQIQTMAEVAAFASENLELVTKLKIDEVLGDSASGAEKDVVSGITSAFQGSQVMFYRMLMEDSHLEDEKQKAEVNEEGQIINTGTGENTGITRDDGDMIRQSSKADNKVYQYILGALQKAGYDVQAANSNQVRGTDSKRELAFVDSNGDEIVWNSKEIANKLAAADALIKITSNADTAAAVMRTFGNEETEMAAKIAQGIKVDEEGNKTFDFSSVAAGLTATDISGLQTQEDVASILGFKQNELTNLLELLGLDLNTFFNNLKEAANSSQGSLQDIGNNLKYSAKTAFEDIDYQDFSVEGKSILAKTYDTLYNQANDADLDNLTKLLNTEDVNIDKFAKAIDAIDWTDSENAAKNFKRELVENGIAIDDSDEALNNFINNMIEINKTSSDTALSLAESESNFKNINDAIKGLQWGDSLDPDHFDLLSEAGKSYFTKMADGTYKLVGDAEKFYSLVMREQRINFEKSYKESGNNVETYKAQRQQIAKFLQDSGLSLNELTKTQYLPTSTTGDWSGIQNQLDFLQETGYAQGPLDDWQQRIKDGTLSQDDLSAIAEAVQTNAEVYNSLADKIANEQQNQQNSLNDIFDTMTSVEELETYLGSDTNDIGIEHLNEGLVRLGLNLGITEEAWTEFFNKVQNGTVTEADTLNMKALLQEQQILELEIDTLGDLEKARRNNKISANEEGTAYEQLAKKTTKGQEALYEYNQALLNCEEGSNEAIEALNNFKKAIEQIEVNEAAQNIYDLMEELKDVPKQDLNLSEYNDDLGSIATQLKNIFGQDFKYDAAFVKEQWDLISQYLTGTEEEQYQAALALTAMGQTNTNNLVDAVIQAFESVGLESETCKAEIMAVVDILQNADFNADGTLSIDTVQAIANVGALQTQAEKTAGILNSILGTDITLDVDGLAELNNALADLINNGPGIERGKSSWADYAKKVTIKARGTAPNYVIPDGVTTVGGGGGGSSNGTMDTVDLDDVVDRYKEIDDAIDDMTRATERASKAADRLYGKSRINQMKAANDMLQQEIGLLKQKQAQAQSYLSTDRAALNAAAAAAGASLSIDGNGNISNYTSQMESLYNQLNSMITAANADGEVSDEEKKNIDEYQKRIDSLKDAISQYDETKELIQDLEDEITDKFYEWQDNNYEILHYELEIEIELNDLQLEYIDYYLNKIEDDFYAMAEAAQYMTNQIPLMTDSLGDYENFYNKITQAYANGEISQADYVDGMKEAYSSILDQLQALNELDKEMMHYYEDTLSAASEELSKYTDRMEHLTSVLGHYKNLIELVNGEYDYESIGKILDAQAKTLKNELDVLTANYKMLLTEKAAIEQSLANAQDDAARELFQKELDAINAAVDEAQENMLSKTEEWAEAQKAIMENAMAEAAHAMEMAFTDGMGFDLLSNSLNRLSSYADEYLTKTNQIYETQKLINTAQQAIDKTTSEAAKARLKAYTDEIQQLQEKNQLSNLELEIAKAKYDVVLAEIALEEAQNAKSTVRLQRDSEGNFGYVYTSDQEQISQAEQDLADAQNALYNIGLDGANEYGQKLLELKQQLADELIALEEARAAGQFATDEEYYAARDQLIQEYNDLFRAYSEQYTIAMGVDTAIQEEAWINAYENMINKTGDWKDITTNYLSICEDKYKEWRIVVEEESEIVNAVLNDVENQVKDVTDASNALRNEVVNSVVPAMNSQLISVRSVTSAYAEQRSAILETIAYYERLVQQIYQAIAAQAALDSAMSSSSGSSGGSGGSDGYADDYSRLMAQAWASGDYEAYEYYKQKREEKIAAGYSDWGVSTEDIDKYLHEKGEGYDIGDAWWTDLLKGGGFATGGYTGKWGPEGKIALLHEKELVLNADDTINFLKGIDVIRSIADSIDLKALREQVSILPYYPGSQIQTIGNELEQNVCIEASFPNVQDRNEIQEAFNTLINKASQYANRK